MAGILGLDPRPFTLRQITTMFESNMLMRWDQTALIATHLINIPIHVSNMLSKRRIRPVKVDQVHPFRLASNGLVLTPDNLKSLKGLFDAAQPVQKGKSRRARRSPAN